MEHLLDAQEYYDIADFFERELEKVTTEYENLFIPVISTAQHFSQSTPEVRVLGQQLSLLQENGSEAIAILNTFASIAKAEEKFQVHPLLLKQMEAQVRPYIDYYNEFGKQQEVNEDDETNKNYLRK
ncbi:MAG: hypothetical protein H0X70_10470 [Segetibacter sp.]|nr:hypothetical protein [Segetibacter sp.]